MTYMPLVITLIFVPDGNGGMIVKAVYDPDYIKSTDTMRMLLQRAAVSQWPEPENAVSSMNGSIGNKLAN